MILVCSAELKKSKAVISDDLRFLRAQRVGISPLTAAVQVSYFFEQSSQKCRRTFSNPNGSAIQSTFSRRSRNSKIAVIKITTICANGSAGRIRTYDQPVNSGPLYLLSYRGMWLYSSKKYIIGNLHTLAILDEV